MKRLKQLVLLLLAVLLILPGWAMSGTALEELSPAEYSANVLYELGLFRGVGSKADGSPDFALEQAANREQAVTMLVRLLGKEKEATSRTWSTPFTDVSSWAKPYVGYAYQNKLTYGMSKTSFGGSQSVSATQYLTFVLRALGYSSESDFAWDRAWELSDALSITYGEYSKSSKSFTRGDVAMISASSLAAPMKDSGTNLLAYLKDSGALAASRLVIMDLEVLSCQPGKMGFAFFPLDGSPNTYSSFQLDRVTVNGLNCTITQYKNSKDARAALSSLETLYPTAFNYAQLSYDEAAAKKASQHSYTSETGQTFPILIFTFECTGTLADGSKVKETFSEAVYIDGYGGL